MSSHDSPGRRHARVLPRRITSVPRAPASSPAGPATPAPRSSRSTVSNLAQSYGGITGSASCTSDSGPFAGPLSPPG